MMDKSLVTRQLILILQFIAENWNFNCFTMAGGIRRKKNNPSKKRDKRLGPIKVTLRC